MAIEGLQSIMRQREAQFGRAGQQSVKQPEEDALKLFFDYIKASNDQMVGICATILDNQKIFEIKLEEIDKKLTAMNIKEE